MRLTRRAEERPAIDVADRAVEPGRLIELVDEQIREIARGWAQLQMDGERRRLRGEIDKVQIEGLRVSDE